MLANLKTELLSERQIQALNRIVNYIWICFLKSLRPYSHGIEHAIEVAELSYTFYFKEAKQIVAEHLFIVYLIALTHDLCDAKYNDCTEEEFLKILYEIIQISGVFFDPFKIIQVVSLISFSKENEALEQKTPLDMEHILNFNTDNTPTNFNYYFFRNIVSDADKIKSLGKEGFQRFILFLNESKPQRNENGDFFLLQKENSNPEEITSKVKLYSTLRMLRLKNEFIRLPTAIIAAQKAHEEYLEAMNEYLLNCNTILNTQ